MADDPREYTPDEIEAVRQQMAEVQQMLRKQAAPMVEAVRTVSDEFDSQSAQIGEALRAVADAATSPVLEMARQAAEQVSKIELLSLDAISEGIERIKPEPMIPLELPTIPLDMPKPREFYIVDAIQDTGEVLNASLDIQRTQGEEIAKIRRSVDHQTTLNRWVLGVAAATFVVSALSIAATVLVALFVV